MVKTLFPTIALQQTRQDRATLLAVQSTPLALADTGTVLFASQLGPFPASGVVQLDFQASFTFPLIFSMEIPGRATYAWSLSGDPSPAQDGQPAYCTHTLFLTRDPATGAPLATGAFISLMPSLGLQTAVIAQINAPLTDIPLESSPWVLKLAAPSGLVSSAFVQILDRALTPET